MEKEIVLKQNLSEETLTNATITILAARYKYVFLIIMAALIINLLSLTLVKPEVRGDTLSNMAPMLIVFVALPTLLYFSIKRAAKKAFIKNSRFYSNLAYTMSEDSFKVEGDKFSNTYSWEELTKIKETKKWILVFTNKAQATIIDKSQLDLWQKDGIDDIIKSIRHKIKVVR